MKRLLFNIIPVNIAILLTQLSLCAQVLPVIRPVQFKKDTFNIVKYGAIADGITLCTKSINAAIDACNKKGESAQVGGKIVV